MLNLHQLSIIDGSLIIILRLCAVSIQWLCDTLAFHALLRQSYVIRSQSVQLAFGVKITNNAGVLTTFLVKFLSVVTKGHIFLTDDSSLKFVDANIVEVVWALIRYVVLRLIG